MRNKLLRARGWHVVVSCTAASLCVMLLNPLPACSRQSGIWPHDDTSLLRVHSQQHGNDDKGDFARQAANECVAGA